MRDWDKLAVTPAPDQREFRSFDTGRVPMLFMQTAHPYVWFSQHDLPPFQSGFAPTPRMRRSDPHLPRWYHTALAVRSTAPDPVAAFRAAAAVVTDGHGRSRRRG